MNATSILFSSSVFLAVFLLLRAATSEVVSRRTITRDMRRMLDTTEDSETTPRERYLLRRPGLEKLSSLEKAVENRREFADLRRLVDQAGVQLPIYRIVLYAIALATIAFGATFASPLAWWAAVLAAAVAASLPILALMWLRTRRVSKIEMQLADAVDMVKRSLRAGNPLVSTFRLVSNNMSDPIAREFGITAADLSYGNDPRSALLSMLDRVPSVSLRGFVTAILVQRETGGNLAETLDHISEVIRQRFRFERKLRTLSAEGRLSAWILIAVPFALGAVLHFTSPNYLGRLVDDPRGPLLLSGGAVLMAVGVVWIRRISRIVI